MQSATAADKIVTEEMCLEPEVQRAVDVLRARHAGPWPETILVLGSGLGAVADALDAAVSWNYEDVPGFPSPGVAGHAGTLGIGSLGGVHVAMLQGREHYYEHGRADAMSVPLRALRALGGQRLLMTNAVGSAEPNYGPGTLVLIADHINLTGGNPLIGAAGGATRFVDMTNAYDANWRRELRGVARELGFELPEAVYACFSGPSFETPAEIHAARVLGAGTVGMSVAPEAIIARHCGLMVAAISVVTNFAAGVSTEPLSHEQTMAAAAKAAPRSATLIKRWLEVDAARGG